MSNSVNPTNFNETLDGYVSYMVDFVLPRLKEEGYSQEQCDRIRTLIRAGIRWGKDEMSMNEAREYEEKTR